MGVIQMLMVVFLGTSTMMDDFRYLGTVDRYRDELKMLVNTSASCVAQFLSTCPETSFGPVAF